MEYMAEQALLLATRQEMIARSLYEVLSKIPTYGIVLVGVGMVWQMLSEENKMLIKEKIQRSGLKKYYTKSLIMENVIKYAPKIDINVPIPESIKPVMEVFGVSKEVPTGELVKELNSHVGKVLEWISANEREVGEGMSKMYEMLKMEKEKMLSMKAGKKKKRKTRKLKRKC